MEASILIFNVLLRELFFKGCGNCTLFVATLFFLLLLAEQWSW